mmetsp:Transcript_4374/g.6639  ORF Transcript_4374/g.6639 Transcript_4374/m.6639 type:complete len:136 (+) Transcript_4374:1502-1909(+)
MYKESVFKKYTFANLIIFAAKNNTFIHVTDLTGKETICRKSGGMKAKLDSEEKSSYNALLIALEVTQICKQIGINAFHVKLKARGGTRSTLFGLAGHTILRTVIREGFNIGRLEDITPVSISNTRKKGGRRGRRI